MASKDATDTKELAKAPDKEPAKTITKEQQQAPAKDEPLYEADELAENALHLFGYHPDVAKAALDYNRIIRASIGDARKVIKEFAERKV